MFALKNLIIIIACTYVAAAINPLACFNCLGGASTRMKKVPTGQSAPVQEEESHWCPQGSFFWRFGNKCLPVTTHLFTPTPKDNYCPDGWYYLDVDGMCAPSTMYYEMGKFVCAEGYVQAKRKTLCIKPKPRRRIRLGGKVSASTTHS
ncbi:hypothetical protein RSOLAG22IIIB_10375 [Rhizoctonia solani]|uniref:Uncharacterized protein n=1 Tax=Rhizoctonia solani TaxID=456999 RepID=A0A0K6G3R5_9AGAM|nr:hypothetical protein RSOLAG22IIIB_10375 [Rhizoctonia solani]